MDFLQDLQEMKKITKLSDSSLQAFVSQMKV